MFDRFRLVFATVLGLCLAPVLLTTAGPVMSQESTTADGTIVEEARDLGSFDAISLRGSVDVVLIQSDRHRATVVGRRDVVSKITTEVRDNALVIDEASGWTLSVRKRHVPRVIVEVVNLKSVALAGSGDVSTKALKAKELTFSVSGSGDVRLAGLSIENFIVKIAGSGDVTASGKATTQRFAIAGSGDVRADQLEGSAVTVSIAGSGDARVWSTQSLKASIAGSGDVRYRGTPQVTKSVAGSGNVAAL